MEVFMKRVFCLILVFVSIFALASCSAKKKKEEKSLVEEEVTKEISAEEGGKIESSDGQTSIEIPADALDSNTTITMRIYDAKDYPGTEGKTVVSKVVEFEPSGTIFKKPVMISMISEGTGEELRAAKKKVVTAAVYKEDKGQWSYSKTGAAVKVGKNAAGDPIMTTAAGDPIMLNAAGDPIMQSTGAMLSAAGDPIMVTAAGDPIMHSAAGDPIMMTTGHFTAYAFFFTEFEDEEVPVEEPTEPEKDDDPVVKDDEENDDDADEISDIEEDDDEPVNDEDEIIVVDEDEDIDSYVAECGNGIVDPGEACDKGSANGTTDCVYGETSCTVCTTACQVAEGAASYCGDGIVQSNEKCDKAETGEGIGSSCSDDCTKMYSKVLCTGMTICTDGEGNQILCPKENEELYGQDAQYAARKGCVPHSYTEIENPEAEEPELRATVQASPFIKDNVTGLTWWLTGRGGSYEEMKDECAVSYGGIEDWRLPTPQEAATLSDLGMLYGNKIDPVYFSGLYSGEAEEAVLDRAVSESYGYDLILTSVENYFYLMSYGVIAELVMAARSSSASGYLMCVSGEKYGEVSAETYSTVTENGAEMIRDLSTDLFWQKEPVKKATWKEALAYCESLDYAGHSDWRLPNKNELLSLVDYSKIAAEAEAEEEEETEEEDEVEAVSSFPGMTADIFWTSTPAPVNYYVWVLQMQTGELFPYGEVSGEPVVGPQQPRSVRSIKRDETAEEEEVYSVLCVRSDLDEKEEIPACDGTGTGPCMDSNGTIWSSVLYPEILADFDKSYISSYYNGHEYEKSVNDFALARMCRYLNENGSNKWRLPTIDEIRKTVTTEKLKFGGSCGVTNEHFAYSYFNEEACSGDAMSKTTLNDYGFMLSGTLTRNEWYEVEESAGEDEEEGNNWPMFWSVDVSSGVLSSVEDSYIPIAGLVQRCVLDNTLDNYKAAPYTDPATGLTWSELAPTDMIWSEAYDYCAALNTEDESENFWRLPTMEELQTLVRHCEEGHCAIALNGRYSVFGDISFSWSSDINEDGTVNSIDFTSVTISKEVVNSTRYVADVRCVSGGESACAGNPCASVENSTGRCLTTTDPEIETGYVCECGKDYTWNGTECLQVAVVN